MVVEGGEEGTVIAPRAYRVESPVGEVAHRILRPSLPAAVEAKAGIGKVGLVVIVPGNPGVHDANSQGEDLLLVRANKPPNAVIVNGFVPLPTRQAGKCGEASTG